MDLKQDSLRKNCECKEITNEKVWMHINLIRIVQYICKIKYFLNYNHPFLIY